MNTPLSRLWVIFGIIGGELLAGSVLAEQARSTESDPAGGSQQLGKPSDAFVRPIDWSRFKDPAGVDQHCRQSQELLLNCVRYNLPWISRTFKKSPSGHMYVLTGMGEHGIRPATSVVYALAVCLTTRAFDEKAVGVTREQVLEQTLKLLRGTAATHKVNGDRAKGWGDAWQSALWAAELGFGGWMLWEHLDARTRGELAALIIHEADRFNHCEVPYWNGQGGDTKAEENAWNSMILNVVVAMMPTHPHVRQWKAKCSELMVSSYATENDWRQNSTVLDGRAVEDWLKGYNAFEDGAVVNHGFIHPDYMTDITMNLWACLTLSLAGKPVPETADFNGAMIYRTLMTRHWPSPPYQAPGGTIYVPGKANVYYPKGVDWSTNDVSAYYRIDVWAHIFGWDKGLPTPATTWMQLRAARMLEMQGRHDDRKMFAKGEYETYPGAEQWVTWCMADSFLALWLDTHKAMATKCNWLAETD